MLKVITGFQLVNFDGTPLRGESGEKEIKLGQIIANVLAGKTTNPTKAWILGKQFATEPVVELLAEDIVFLKASLNALAVDPNGWLASLVCGQVVEVLDGKNPNAIEKTAENSGAENSALGNHGSVGNSNTTSPMPARRPTPQGLVGASMPKKTP